MCTFLPLTLMVISGKPFCSVQVFIIVFTSRPSRRQCWFMRKRQICELLRPTSKKTAQAWACRGCSQWSSSLPLPLLPAPSPLPCPAGSSHSISTIHFHSLPFFCLKNRYHTRFSWADLGFGIGHKSRRGYEVRERKYRKGPGVHHLQKDAVFPTSKVGGKVLHREPILPKWWNWHGPQPNSQPLTQMRI